VTEDIEASLAPIVEEVLKLRLQATLPDSNVIPQAVLDSLLDVRSKADRVEELNIKVMRLRAYTARKVAALKAAADDEWAQALVSRKRAGARSGDQFEGPRERYAEADLVTLELRRSLRKAEELLSIIDEASDVIKVAFRGLTEIIQDHRTWLRTIQTQSYYDK
jgi:hypothetical protein